MKPTAAQVTPEVIKEWKEKHGKVTKYATVDGKIVYFRSPSRAEVAATQAANQDSDGITSNEVLAKATALGGDLEILTQDKYLMGLGKHLKKIFETVEGEATEL
jgi:hypothetical protein